MQNIPTPRVRYESGHSYILIRQCIADYLGKGYLPKKIMKSTSLKKDITDSVWCQKVKRNAMLKNPNVPQEDLLVAVGT